MYVLVEPMELRRMFAITAAINPQTGLLSINGDGADNVIVVSRDAAGTILVNAGAVPVLFGPATVVNTARVDIRGFTGNDNVSVNESNGVMPRTDMSGGEGNDTLLGGSKVEVIHGDDGDDFIDGRGGDDALNGEAGNDTFAWSPGDGNDFIQAGLGSDTIRFDGSNGNETFELFNDDGFFSITRNLGTVALLIQDLETANVTAFGGQDVVNVRDLTGTDVTGVNVNLVGSSGTPDGQIDDVLVEGTPGNDTLLLNRIGTTDLVSGAAASISIASADNGVDELAINAFGGADLIRVDGSSNTPSLTLDGAAGNDTIFGSVRGDVLLGGAGNDVVEGKPGDDVVFLGEGDDQVFWSIDDNDTIEGQAGNDLLVLEGRVDVTAAETFTLSAFGPRLRVAHSLNELVDAGGLETVDVRMQTGPDNLVIHNLAGTEVTRVNVDLRQTNAPAPDGQADTVTVNADDAANTIDVSDTAEGTSVTGLPARVDVTRADAALDVLTINALDGQDTINVTQDDGPGDVRRVAVNAGAGTDTIRVNNTATDGAVTVIPSAGGDGVNANDDSVGVANVVFGATQRIGSLTLRDGAAARLTPGGAKVLTMTGIGLFGNGTLDLADNSMVFDYTTVTSVNGFRNILARGFNGGDWGGTGITSSAAASDPRTGIGLAEATDLFATFPASFKGQSIDNTSIILSHTLSGDANLDGNVNLTDFNRLAANFGQSNRRWSQGDFDYNGTVNLSDFNRLAANFGSVAGGIEDDAELTA